MIMEMLEAGGMDVHKTATRKDWNARYRQGDYLPNPIDLYEPDYGDWKIESPREYDGMAVKVLSPFIPRMAVHDYRVCYMLRNHEEIRQSFEAAFGSVMTINQIERVEDEAIKQLKNRRDVADIVYLDYKNVVHNPAESLGRLDWPVNIEIAAKIPIPDNYRFREGRLVVGL